MLFNTRNLEQFPFMIRSLPQMCLRLMLDHFRCSTDLAELPSTLMEHFSLDTRVTVQYARHFETGEAPNSPEDVKALLHLSASRGYGQSVEVMLQLMHSILDQRFHSDSPSKILAPFQTGVNGPPSARFFDSLLKEHCSSWLSLELPPQLAQLPVATTHRFGHLYSYGGRYYSYLMARAAAGLIWRKGFAADPWSSSFGRVGFELITRACSTGYLSLIFIIWCFRNIVILCFDMEVNVDRRTCCLVCWARKEKKICSFWRKVFVRMSWPARRQLGSSSIERRLLHGILFGD